eukprot:scaffold9437_cov31-Attheya_sp.AAC.3
MGSADNPDICWRIVMTSQRRDQESANDRPRALPQSDVLKRTVKWLTRFQERTADVDMLGVRQISEETGKESC